MNTMIDDIAIKTFPTDSGNRNGGSLYDGVTVIHIPTCTKLSVSNRGSLCANKAEALELIQKAVVGKLTYQQMEDEYNRMSAMLQQQVELMQHQLEAMKAMIKQEAHEAYWDASDSNRADRWAESFDESVRLQFENYWHLNDKDKVLPSAYLAHIQSHAGQAGWNACVDYLVENSSADLFTDGEAEQARQVGLQYAEAIRKG